MRLLSSFVLLAAFAAGCQSGPRLPEEFVQQAQYLHDASLRTAVLSDPELNGYLDDLGKRIIAGATASNASNTRDPVLANMQFHFVASDVINAYGTGGGHIYLYNGLLQLCENEEELAALLAVQYAHALDLDIKGTGLQPVVGAAPDPLSVSRVVFNFANAPFSAAQCFKADEKAFEIYARGGWDPAKFVTIYERLKGLGYDLPPTIGGGGQPRPQLSARAAALRPLRQKLPTQSRDWIQANAADPGNFNAEVKARARQLTQRTDNTNRALLYFAAFPNVVLPADLNPQQLAQAQLRRDVTPPPVQGTKIEPN